MKIQVINTKLDVLGANWSKFDTNHKHLSEVKSDALLDTEYTKTRIYDRCLSLYTEAKAALLIERDAKEQTNPVSGTQLADVSALTTAANRQSLPELTLGTCNGDYLAWRPFQDMFIAVIGRHTELSDVEKMHYLKTSLTGDAAQLIANIAVSGDFFSSAWDRLVERFENKRLLYSA